MNEHTKIWVISAIIVLLVLVIIMFAVVTIEQPRIDGKEAFCESHGGNWYYTGSVVDGTCTIIKGDFAEGYYVEGDNGNFYFTK